MSLLLALVVVPAPSAAVCQPNEEICFRVETKECQKIYGTDIYEVYAKDVDRVIPGGIPVSVEVGNFIFDFDGDGVRNGQDRAIAGAVVSNMPRSFPLPPDGTIFFAPGDQGPIYPVPGQERVLVGGVPVLEPRQGVNHFAFIEQCDYEIFAPNGLLLYGGILYRLRLLPEGGINGYEPIR